MKAEPSVPASFQPVCAVCAVLAVLGWTAGAALSRMVGLWPGMAVTAVVLGAGALALDGPALRPLLRPRPGPTAAGLLAGGVMVVATYALYFPLARAVPGIARQTDLLYAHVARPGGLSPALVLVPVVVGEELVWRGLVQGVLARRTGSGAAVVLAAALYAAALAPVGSLLLVFTALACGLFWGGLRAATASLVAPLVAHLLWDEVVILLWPLAGG